jgi:uncharacterized membrane protein (DUF106 family)
MRTHVAVFIVGVLLGFIVLTATSGLAAQESTLAGTAPIADQAALLHAATPEATDAEMVAKMERMIEQCTTMMEMMTGMMGMMDGDMSGMMGDESMHGMGDMPATPMP